MATKILRNLLSTSSDMPLGYPIYVSPILTSAKTKKSVVVLGCLQKSLKDYRIRSRIREERKKKEKLERQKRRILEKEMKSGKGGIDDVEMQKLNKTDGNLDKVNQANYNNNNNPNGVTNSARSFNSLLRASTVRDSLVDISHNFYNTIRNQVESLNPMNRIDRARHIHLAKSGSDTDLFEMKIIAATSLSKQDSEKENPEKSANNPPNTTILPPTTTNSSRLRLGSDTVKSDNTTAAIVPIQVSKSKSSNSINLAASFRSTKNKETEAPLLLNTIDEKSDDNYNNRSDTLEE